MLCSLSPYSYFIKFLQGAIAPLNPQLHWTVLKLNLTVIFRVKYCNPTKQSWEHSVFLVEFFVEGDELTKSSVSRRVGHVTSSSRIDCGRVDCRQIVMIPTKLQNIWFICLAVAAGLFSINRDLGGFAHNRFLQLQPSASAYLIIIATSSAAKWSIHWQAKWSAFLLIDVVLVDYVWENS